MRIAKRLRDITASPTMAVMQEAQELRNRGIDIIDLGPGQPDFPTPDSVKTAGIAAIESNFTNYTPAAGVKELRQAVADRYNGEWGSQFDASNVMITSGAKNAIYDLAMALFQEGDEVLVPSPYWVTFPEVIRLCGSQPVTVPTSESSGFLLSADLVESQMNRRTLGLIVNTPCNPTGAVMPSKEIEQIALLARETGLFLLFDETYDRFTYGGTRHTSLAAFVREADDFFGIVGSFSKTYSMTGWRVGYCLGSAELIQKLNEFQSHQTGNPCSISQKAALAALASGDSDFELMREEYAQRRELILELIETIPGWRCVPPEGAFYVFPNVQGAMVNTGCETSQEFSQFLIREARVATVPGSAFGLDGYVRLSYAASAQKIREAMGRIRTALS